jgi:hypothetical protein
MAELSYDIEQLYIEGFSPKYIALTLECPLDMVYQWIESNGVEADEDCSPYATVNS